MSDVQVRTREVEHDGETVEEDFVMILEQEGSTFKSKDIRKMCKLLGVSGYKNCSKAVMLDLIAQKQVNDAAYTTIFQQKKVARSDPTRKQPQCPFRLLNIVFSDEFAFRLDALGDRRVSSWTRDCLQRSCFGKTFSAHLSAPLLERMASSPSLTSTLLFAPRR
jgi:hypothetical protein